MRDSWTDARLDDLNAKVDRGFERVDGEIGELRSEMKEGFAAVNGRIDSLQHTMLQGVIAISLALLADFAGIIALIATPL